MVQMSSTKTRKSQETTGRKGPKGLEEKGLRNLRKEQKNSQNQKTTWVKILRKPTKMKKNLVSQKR